jgi:hypothetical protein
MRLVRAISALGRTWWLVSSSDGETIEPVPKPSRRRSSRMVTRATARPAASPSSKKRKSRKSGVLMTFSRIGPASSGAAATKASVSAMSSSFAVRPA